MPTTNWNKRKECADPDCTQVISDEATHCRTHTPGSSKPVSIIGVEYSSVKAACEGLGMARSKVIYRLKSKSNKWVGWKYLIEVSDEEK